MSLIASLPVGVDTRDIEDWHYHEEGELSEVEDWLIENRVFSPGMVREIPRADVSNSALALVFSNGEDPYLISMVRGMDFLHLNRFKMFDLSLEGEKEIRVLNYKWASDERYFDHMSEIDFIRHENGRNRRLYAEARAYYIMANKHRPEIFKTSLERLFDDCFEI